MGASIRCGPVAISGRSGGVFEKQGVVRLCVGTLGSFILVNVLRVLPQTSNAKVKGCEYFDGLQAGV